VVKKIFILLICGLLVVVIYKIFFFDQNNKDTILLEVSGINQSTLTETPIPTTSPTPSPTPVPTPTPFSYYAPTVLMDYVELVGNNKDYTEYSKIPIPPPPPDTYKLVINLYYQFITIFKKDTNGDFTVPVRYILCSTGKQGTPTPVGEFEIGSLKWRFPAFENTDYFAQYWTQLSGTSYLHSILYSRADAYYYKPNSFRKLGTKASSGCIRMPVPDARWIWYTIAPGTKAVVIEGEEDLIQAKIREQLSVILDKFPLGKERPEILKEKSVEKIPVTEPWPGYTGLITPLIKEKNQESTIVDETISPENQK